MTCDGSSDREVVNAVLCTSEGVVVVWDKPNQPDPKQRVLGNRVHFQEMQDPAFQESCQNKVKMKS